MPQGLRQARQRQGAGPGSRTNTLVRQLALAKLRELRRSGLSYREITRLYARGRGATEGNGTFAYRLPPERLLGYQPEDGAVQTDAALFLRALDAVPQPLAFYTCAGELLHANRPAYCALKDAPEAEWLRAEAEHFARSVCALVRVRGEEGEGEVMEAVAVQEISVSALLRLSGSYVGLNLFGSGPSVLLSLEQPAPDPLAESSLRERFGLTRQEARMTRLLAEGWSNQEIAERLSISAHTAKRHTEHVLHKLGVRSRAEVAIRVLRSGPGPREDENRSFGRCAIRKTDV